MKRDPVVIVVVAMVISLLLVFGVLLGFIAYGNYSIIRFNLNLAAPHPPLVNMSVPQ